MWLRKKAEKIVDELLSSECVNRDPMLKMQLEYLKNLFDNGWIKDILDTDENICVNENDENEDRKMEYKPLEPELMKAYIKGMENTAWAFELFMRDMRDTYKS